MVADDAKKECILSSRPLDTRLWMERKYKRLRLSGFCFLPGFGHDIHTCALPAVEQPSFRLLIMLEDIEHAGGY